MLIASRDRVRVSYAGERYSAIVDRIAAVSGWKWPVSSYKLSVNCQIRISLIHYDVKWISFTWSCDYCFIHLMLWLLFHSLKDVIIVYFRDPLSYHFWNVNYELAEHTVAHSCYSDIVRQGGTKHMNSIVRQSKEKLSIIYEVRMYRLESCFLGW